VGDQASTRSKSRRKDWRETRERILTTFARMVVDDGVRDVSIQQVADRAGISHRTVYRHFASRQELIDELAVWLSEKEAESEESDVMIPLDELPSAIERTSRWFEQVPDLMKAYVLVTWESNALTALQHQRTQMFYELLAPATQHLDDDERQAVLALVRYLASSQTWLTLREEFGVLGDRSGPVVGWAVELLLDALRRGAHPVPGGVLRKESHDDQ
jgi:AcrR family transcriptional regulator